MYISKNAKKTYYYTTNPEGFLEMKQLPSFANDQGIVLLQTQDSVIIDELHYDENMHFQLLKKEHLL